MPNPPTLMLGISGSLRAASSNSQLLRAAERLVPAGVRLAQFDGLGALPHFNPDLDIEPADAAVRHLRERVAEADAILISSPEYAHGVPGVLKNALDWLVSGVEIVGKPIGVLNASPRSTHAQASLIETLHTMSANVVASAQASVPLLGRSLDAAGIVADDGLAASIRTALAALTAAVPKRPPDGP